MAITARGHIEQLPSGSFRVSVYAGINPVTGKPRRLKQTCPNEASAAAALGKLLAQAGDGEAASPTGKGTLGPALIKYLEGRRPRRWGRPGEGATRAKNVPPHHRAGSLGCGGGEILRIHSIISSALDLAVRYDWTDRNVARNASPPHPRKREPDPPTPDQAARLLNLVWAEDEEFGLYLWTAFTAVARRGEVSALRRTASTSPASRSGWPATTWSSWASTSRRHPRTGRAASCPWTC